MIQQLSIKLFIFSIILFGIEISSIAQKAVSSDSNLVQFSGVVLDGSTEQLFPLPYANLFVKTKGMGTYTDFKGFFSIVVEKGDKIEISAVGYKSVVFEIPDSLTENRYSLVQLMTQDTINLPETVVFPWPSKENFKQEFLAMDVSEELQAIAAKNVAKKSLEQMRDEVPWDGNENADYYLRQQARQYYYAGQTPPMNIFSPVAWSQFFKAWKNGDFKKKEK